MKIPIATYKVRASDDDDDIYASDIEEEAAAFARAQEVADFYQRCVEVCQRLGGIVKRRIGIVEPDPPAPTG